MSHTGPRECGTPYLSGIATRLAWGYVSGHILRSGGLDASAKGFQQYMLIFVSRESQFIHRAILRSFLPSKPKRTPRS